MISGSFEITKTQNSFRPFQAIKGLLQFSPLVWTFAWNFCAVIFPVSSHLTVPRAVPATHHSVSQDFYSSLRQQKLDDDTGIFNCLKHSMLIGAVAPVATQVKWLFLWLSVIRSQVVLMMSLRGTKLVDNLH